MQLKKNLLAIAVAGVVASLTACGGGGGSSTPAPTGGGSATNDPYKVSDWYNAGQNNRMANPALSSVGLPTSASPDLQDAAYTFTASSPDMQDAAYAIDLSAVDARFVATDYIGAYPQDSMNNWTSGWTVWLNGNDSIWEPAAGGTLAGATPAADGACPTGTTDIGDQALPASVGGGMMDLCQLSARITADTTLTNDNVYALAAGFPGTYIGNGEVADGNSANDMNVTLTIEPGSLIVGDSSEALSVTRGSQITAVGTAVDPIVFSSRPQLDRWVNTGDATSGRGEWAGLALMGYAKTNECGVPCDVAAEGNIGAYGGTDDTDSSGTLKYVVIRHAGNDIDGNGNELNGLTMFATGSGTNVDYVQVHKNLDDGVEHFGSADFMSHLVLTANKDDSFDWGQGYTGGAQFIVIKQDTDTADRGIEADNDKLNPLVAPVSAPTLANMTIMSRGTADSKGEQGILLRRGTGAKIYNSVITGFRDSCIDMDGADTLNMANTLNDSSDSSLEIFNSIIHCPAGVSFKDDTDVAVADITSWFNADGSNRITDPNLDSVGMPNSPNGAGTKFVSTDYVGAFPQDTSDNWTAGWTVSLNGNTSVWQPAAGGTLAGATPAADAACPAGTTDIGDQTLPGGGTMDLCQLAARYTTDVTLTNDNVYALASGFPGTYIGNGEVADGNSANDLNVTLTIEPGTLIAGAASEALSVTRGSQINAVGTAVDPIVFTSRLQLDNWVNNNDATSGRGEWAGLALMGYAKTNECGTPCDVAAEGNIGAYGGTDDTDDSGTLKYVVIRHAGNDIDGNGNELNGLTMFATGSGTDIDYVQVHKNLDDGVEHFGSADFMSHLVLTDNKDDSFDWGQGYTGGAQFIVVKQAADSADRGIEADNDKTDPQAGPISMPTLANMTFISAGTADSKPEQGILLRRGTGAKIWNTIVTGFAGSCIDIDDTATFDRAGANAPTTLTGELVMNNSIVNCTTDFDEE